MQGTVLGAVHGMNQRTLQQLLGGWNFALAFRRELSCTLDVCYVAAQRRVANLDGPLVKGYLPRRAPKVIFVKKNVKRNRNEIEAKNSDFVVPTQRKRKKEKMKK